VHTAPTRQTDVHPAFQVVVYRSRGVVIAKFLEFQFLGTTKNDGVLEEVYQ
jgi:hypothetical protein